MGDFAFCGWRLQSDLSLPDLAPWAGEPRRPDITLQRGPLPATLAAATVETPFLRVGRDRSCRLTIPSLGNILIRRGREIIVDFATPLGEAEFATFLHGRVLRILALQRDLIALPAAAVDMDGGVIFAGPSGAGKTTVAAGLAQRGYRILSDEVVIIETGDKPHLRVASPGLKVWHDALEALGVPVPALPPTRKSQERYRILSRTPETDDAASVPMRVVYLLGDHSTLEPNPLEAREAAAQLQEIVTAGPYGTVADAKIVARDLRKIVQQVPVVPLPRARDLASLRAWLDAFEARPKP